ncbi:MAG: dephospho-CoA kinase [Zhaonellaceae bacterium]|jgi:dephospho-CoA kinase|nr:dephospho-CoA kinase [Clostridia bacterium]
MKVIGLTGGIASGKSTVSNKLRELGAVIVDADAISREVVKKDGPVWHKIKEHFGSSVLLPSGEINRKALGNIIFNNSEARNVLNSITHPEIFKRAKEKIKALQKSGSKVIVFDVPLLIESGYHTMVDKIWLVYCSKETQIKRLMTRNGLSREEAISRIESQLPLEEKLRYADEIINTEGSLSETEHQVQKLWFRYFSKEC